MCAAAHSALAPCTHRRHPPAASFSRADWIASLDEISADQLETLQGTSDGIHEGKFGAAALAEVEGFVCRTYQKCCRDPALETPVSSEVGSGADVEIVYTNRTCLQAHEGVGSDIAITMEDPSKENFCPCARHAATTTSGRPRRHRPTPPPRASQTSPVPT